MHISEHVRLFMLILLLGVSDYVHVSLILNSMSFLSEDQSTRSAPSVHFLFAFEFSILLVSLFTLTIKYAILWYDMRSDHMWEAKPVVTFYVDLTSDLLRLFLYTSFFVIVCSYFGLPLHLIRELYATFHTLRERVVNYLRYKRLIRNLNERFPDATPEQISARSDDQCIICREEMRSGKVLPCSHLFHFNCLRTWLERSSTCPICRAAIPDLLAAEPPPAPANRPQDRARVHVPAAAPVAPIIGAAVRQEHDADVTRHAAIPSSLQQGKLWRLLQSAAQLLTWTQKRLCRALSMQSLWTRKGDSYSSTRCQLKNRSASIRTVFESSLPPMIRYLPYSFTCIAILLTVFISSCCYNSKWTMFTDAPKRIQTTRSHNNACIIVFIKVLRGNSPHMLCEATGQSMLKRGKLL